MHAVAVERSNEAVVAHTHELETVRCNDLTVTAKYESTLRSNGLDSLEGLFGAAGDNLSKPGLDSWRQRVRLTVTDGEKSSTWYLKLFDGPPASARRAMRHAGSNVQSLAGLEWARARELTAAGVPCAVPVAYGEQLDKYGREQRSALVFESVPGVSLEHWAGSEALNPEDLRRVSGELASVVARMHGCGFVHRDLYFCHVFFDFKTRNDPLHLIDLHRVFRPACCLRRWIVKDLAALNMSAPASVVSAAQRLRWLCDYLEVPRLDAPAKRLAYRIIGKTARIQRHQTRRERRHGLRAKRSERN